jgi:hypothetical protein
MATNPKVQVDIVANDEATDDLKKVEAKMAALEGETTTIKVDATSATGNIDQLGKSADSSKSVLANMVGNASQDVAGLGGVAGSAGVAIGQMGEYMADARASGEKLGSVLSSFATVAGPIAAVALAVKTFGDVMARFEASQKRSAETQERWTDALMAGGDAAAEYADQLTDVGKITLDLTREQTRLENVLGEIDSKWYLKSSIGIFGQLLGDASAETKDLTESFAQANIKVDEWTSIIAGSAADQQRFIEGLEQTTLSADAQKDIVALLRQEVEDLTEAEKNYEARRAVFGATGPAADFGHAPAAGIAAIIETNADRRAALTTNVFLPPGTPDVHQSLGNQYIVRNSMRTGP